MEGDSAGTSDNVDTETPAGDDSAPAEWHIERAVLNESVEGREIANGFVRIFGAFVTNEVRPLLRHVADEGGEPQLLMNGLAELLRATAEQIEFPVDHPRAGSPRVGK